MTDDLVKRLRAPAFGTETSERLLMEAAADRIAALEAENARLRAQVTGLQAYLAGEPSMPPVTGQAKRTLTGEQP